MMCSFCQTEARYRAAVIMTLSDLAERKGTNERQQLKVVYCYEHLSAAKAVMEAMFQYAHTNMLDGVFLEHIRRKIAMERERDDG